MVEIYDEFVFKPHTAMSVDSFEKFKVAFSFTRKDGLTEKEIMRILASFKKQLKRESRKTKLDAFVMLHKILNALAEEYVLKLFTEKVGDSVVIVLSDYDVNSQKKYDNLLAILTRAELSQAEAAFMYRKPDNTGTYRTALVQEVFEDYFLGYHYGKSGGHYRHYSFENMSCMNLYYSKTGFHSFEASFSSRKDKIIYSLRESSADYESKYF